MKAYRIANWLELYEVSIKGKATKGGLDVTELRKSKLRFVQLRVHGHSLGPAYRRLLKTASEVGVLMEMAAFGLFCKLLELAADQERELRGWILDEKGQPVTAEQITDILGLSVAADERYVQKLLNILSSPEIGWVEFVEFPANSGKVGEFPEKSGKEGESCGGEKGRVMGEKRGELYNETKLKQKQNLTETEDLPVDNSVSDSNKKNRQIAALKLSEILRINPANRSDITTIRNVLNQIEKAVENGRCRMDVWEGMIEAAKNCHGNKIAMFVARMKQPPFCYQPAGNTLWGAARSLLAGKSGT